MQKLLTEREAAERCGWSESWMRWRRSEQEAGKASDLVPPFTRIDRSIRYVEADLERWLARHPEVAKKDSIVETWLSSEEVAEILKISDRTLRVWRTKQRAAAKSDRHTHDLGPPWIKVGKHIRYSKRELMDWIRKHRGNA